MCSVVPMGVPCANCCRGIQPCLGGDCSAAEAFGEKRVYELEYFIELRGWVRVRAASATEAWRLVQVLGIRELARRAWRYGRRRLWAGATAVRDEKTRSGTASKPDRGSHP